MNPGNLNTRIELHGKIEFINELGEKDYYFGFIKKVWANIITINLKGTVGQGQATTQYSEVTHRIKIRKSSIKNLSTDMYFIIDEIRYDVIYFQPDFKNREFWEIMVKIKFE